MAAVFNLSLIPLTPDNSHCAAKTISEEGMEALLRNLKLDAVVVPSGHIGLVRHASLGG
jgi:hypothetical protein